MSNKSSLWLMVFLLFFSACRNESEQLPHGEASDTRPYKLICLGSDFSIGVGLDPKQAYPALLQERLDQKGLSVKVVNASIKGETILGATQRIPWLLQQRVDGFILELGAREAEQSLPVPTITTQWTSLLETIRKAKPTVDIFVWPTSTDQQAWKQLQQDFNLILLDPAAEWLQTTDPAATHTAFADWFSREHSEQLLIK